MLTVKRALISVFDKRGLVDFAKGLDRLGIQIVSTGGTFAKLEGAGLEVTKVSDVTEFPEILDGRVKTLHPKIHGGILADRERAAHARELAEHAIAPIDLVVVNLYPFRETVAKQGTTFTEIVDMIDVGGPTMVRAAAKNFRSVVVVVDPEDYPQVLAALESGDGEVPESLRRNLALKAFRHTQAYDSAIAEWLQEQAGAASDDAPAHLLLDLGRAAALRYGENPHQPAALYEVTGGGGVFGGFEQLQGKQLSFNNLLDVEAARQAVKLFSEPATAIIKHTNPCGVGRGASVRESYERALACDPVSAFGGIVALNAPVDEETAAAISSRFVEVVVAPDFDNHALAQFAKKTGLRVLRAPNAERRALTFAWTVCRAVRSNAIVVTNEHQTVGIGAGQMSRVDSCRLALSKAQLDLAGTVAASDGFFPFRDGLDVLAEAGVAAVVQPGGSKRDEEVVAAANEHGLAMLLTGRRHFKH